MGGGKVLVVDDDEDVLRTVGLALERDGLDVRVARNAVQALALFDVSTPDLVLLDLVMPVSGGWELVSRLRGDPRSRRVPVVLLSAHPGLESEARRLGIARWLRKPCPLDRLLATIQSSRDRRV